MKENHVLDDMAKVLGSAVGNALEARREVERMIKAQIEKFFKSQDAISREEFETVRQLAAKAREEQEKMLVKIELLEREIKEMKGEKF